jgi:recombination protein RecA
MIVIWKFINKKVVVDTTYKNVYKEKCVDIQALKRRLQDSVKGSHIEILSESTIASSRDWFSTPSYDLNRILSGSLYKGLPSKSLTMLVAPEASFKSSFMCLCAAKAQSMGYTPVIFDTEGAWTGDFVTRWGLDPDNILYIYTPWVDEIMVMMGSIIDDEESDKMFIVFDSIGGLEALKMVDDAVGKDAKVKADQGTLVKNIKRMLKMFLNIVKRKNSVGIMSGHFFGNPNSYGGADEIGGGKFAKLAPDIIISMKKQQILEDPKAKVADRVVIGNEIKAVTLKNRFYPPFQEATIQISYKDGINPMSGLLDIALTCGIVEKAGSWYSLAGTSERMGQGEIKTLEWMSNNQELFLPKIEKILKTTGYSTVNKDVEEAEKLAEVGMESPVEQEVVIGVVDVVEAEPPAKKVIRKPKK